MCIEGHGRTNIVTEQILGQCSPWHCLRVQNYGATVILVLKESQRHNL